MWKSKFYDVFAIDATPARWHGHRVRRCRRRGRRARRYKRRRIARDVSRRLRIRGQRRGDVARRVRARQLRRRARRGRARRRDVARRRGGLPRVRGGRRGGVARRFRRRRARPHRRWLVRRRRARRRRRGLVGRRERVRRVRRDRGLRGGARRGPRRRARRRRRLCGKQSTSVSSAPDNSSLSHFSVLSRREDVVGPAGVGLAGPSLFRSQVSSRSTPQVPVALHELVGGAGAGARHAIEQASRRWRGGRRGDSGRTRRKLDFHTGRCVRRQRRRVRARSRRGNARGPRRRRRVARLHRGARRN